MQKPRILLVEDDEETLDLERTVFAHVGGYEVERADSVPAALSAFAARPPDLVLLDIVMPEVDGWTFVEDPSVITSTVPIVVLTGMAKALPPSHLRRRICGYLTKPFDVRRLLSGCDHVLSRSAARSRPSRRAHDRRTFLLDAVVRCGGAFVRGQLHDIADGGVRLHCDTALPFGEVVRSRVRVPWHDCAIEIDGHVRWRDLQLHGIAATRPIGHDPIRLESATGH